LVKTQEEIGETYGSWTALDSKTAERHDWKCRAIISSLEQQKKLKLEILKSETAELEKQIAQLNLSECELVNRQ